MYEIPGIMYWTNESVALDKMNFPIEASIFLFSTKHVLSLRRVHMTYAFL